MTMNLFQIYRAGILFLTIPFMLSCSPSTEDAGKEFEQKKYECMQMRVAYSVTEFKTMLDDLREGKFKTRQELQSKSEAYRDTVGIQTMKRCEHELEAFEDELKLKFPRPDDRQTLRNTFDSYYKILEKDIWLERDKIRVEFEAERNKLPYR